MKILISNDILDNFKLKNHEYLVDMKHYDDLSGIQEYRLYSYLSTFFNDTIILDIGTFNGRSAIALSYNETNHVISYNITDNINNDNHKIYTKSNVTFKIKNVLEDLTKELLYNVKLIMIDIDHFELIEQQIIDKLYELNFSGIIILDDIIHPNKEEYECMQRLWNNLNFKKYDMTKYGHFSGTGIILMNTEIDFEFNNENKKQIFVEGVGGLGNCLFQISTAIYYSEIYKYNIVLNDKSLSLHYGTSNFTNRNRTKTENDKLISYENSIFNKFKYDECLIDSCKKIHNDFTSNIIIPNNNDSLLLVSGYCQNKDLFKEILPKLTNYLNLYDESTMNSFINKYNIDVNKKNIMIGIRICNDFSHMNKVTSQSYEKALKLFVNEKETDYNIIIISDSCDYQNMINFDIKGRIIYINEDDITQLNVALLCNHFILSESTYHYWIAAIKNFINPNTNVICFNDTDLTNRNLAFENWTKINY
jgi:hypothetical protein